MLVLEIVLAVAVVFVVGAVAAGYGGSMTTFQPDWPGRGLPEGRTLRSDDVTAVGFSVAFRGYRMSEVDDTLDRLAWEIATRDLRILELTGQPYEAPPRPLPALPESVADTEAATPQAEPEPGVDPAAEPPARDAVISEAAAHDPASTEQ